MKTIDIYRPASPSNYFLTAIYPDDSSTQQRKVMAENQLNITFEMNSYVQFMINDYCTVFDEKYVLHELPQVTKGSVYYFKYSMVLKSETFDLGRYQYLFYDNNNDLTLSEFSVMGNAETFLDLLITNANRVGAGWLKGEVLSTAYKNITFSKDNCYNALVRVAEEFATEFVIEGKKINLVKKQKDTGYIFKVGKNKGLYEINRINIDSSSLVTRIYAFGSEKNLPADYYSNRLRLPGVLSECVVSNLSAEKTINLDLTQTWAFVFNPAPGANVTGLNFQYRLAGSSDPWVDDIGANESPRNVTQPAGIYEFRIVTIATGACDAVTSDVIAPDTETYPLWPNPPIPYLENNTSVYGVIEHTEIFDDIFPTRTGKVSSVNIADIYELTDTSINFDLNNYLLPGITAKIVFNTGQLAGYEFEIASYNHGTKKISILKNKNERVMDLPNSSLKPAIADEYVLVDIRLPQRYIYEAETKLKTKAQELLNTNSIPQVSYQVVLDPVYIARNNIRLNPNDLVWIKDDQMGIERRIRVNSVTRNIVYENTYSIELSDVVQPTTLQRVLNSVNTTERDITAVDRQVTNTSILNNRVIGDLNMKQGTIIMEDIPETATTTGFEALYIETATGKLFKKV